ncbi:DUF2255 family protein, partial [Streptomyces niveus]
TTPSTGWPAASGRPTPGAAGAAAGGGGAGPPPPTARHSGHISSGGVDKDVMFVEEDSPALNDRIDAAYRTKYARFGPSYVDPMVADGARAATLKLVPR